MGYISNNEKCIVLWVVQRTDSHQILTIQRTGRNENRDCFLQRDRNNLAKGRCTRNIQVYGGFESSIFSSDVGN